MTSYTANYSIPSPDGTDGVVVHSDLKKAVDKVDEAIFNSLWFKEAGLTTSDNLGLLPAGVRTIWNGTTALELGLPENSMYTIETERWGASAGIQTAKTRGTTTVRVYRRQLLSGGWTSWKDVSPWYDTTALSATDVINDLPSGVRTVWNGPLAETLGLPEAVLGVVTTARWGASAGIQTFEARSLNVTTWKRALLSGGWGAWKKVGANGGSGSASLRGRGSSGFKILPVILTAGNGGSSTAPLSARVTYPMNWAPDIFRYQILLRDGNPRFGLGKSNTVTITNLSVDGTTLISSATTPGDGSFWESPVFSGKPKGDLAFDYSASIEPISLVGAGTINGAVSGSMPFEIYLRVEVLAGTPGLGLVGDSNSVGVGCARPVYDSYWSVYCRRVGAIPIHYGHSGDTLGNFEDPNHYKYTRWDDLDRPDMVMEMLGSNDMGSGTLEFSEMQRRKMVVWDNIRSVLSPNIHVGTLKPRNTNVGNYETIRRQLNTWLKSLPYSVLDWHELNTPVSADDENIDAQYNADGTHMNTAGHLKLAGSIIKRVGAWGGHVVNETAGRVVKIWDYLNNREQLIYGDTGLRTFSTNIGGTAILRRVGVLVKLELRDLVLAGSDSILTIPSGFQGDYSPNYGLVGRTGGRVPVYFTLSGSSLAQNGAATGTGYASLMWTTNDPWPTTLPGSAIGTIPYQ